MMRLVRAAVVVAVLTASPYATSADKGVDWTALRPDNKVSGQMLCVLGLYMMVQEVTAGCNWPRKPVDDAIDRAVSTIQRFMIANSSYHPTQETFDGMRRTIAGGVGKTDRKFTCDSSEFDKSFRSAKPELIDTSIDALLKTPPKPNENVPCL